MTNILVRQRIAARLAEIAAPNLNSLSPAMRRGYDNKLAVLEKDFGPLTLMKFDDTGRKVFKTLKFGTNYRAGFDNDELFGQVRNLIFTLKSPQGGTLILERREGATQTSDYWRVSVNGSKPVTIPGQFYDALAKTIKKQMKQL